MSTQPFKVAVIDDDPLVCSALTTILTVAGEVEVVATALDGASAIETLRAIRCDVALLDVMMPGLGGLATAARLRALPHPPAVLMLTAFDESDLVIKAVAAGAVGYLLKGSSPQQILAAVEAAARGLTPFSPQSVKHLVDHVAHDTGMARRLDARSKLAGLTAREIATARLLTEGLTNQQIASRLFVSERTVKAHLTSASQKTGCVTRVQLALLLQQADLTDA